MSVFDFKDNDGESPESVSGSQRKLNLSSEMLLPLFFLCRQAVAFE